MSDHSNPEQVGTDDEYDGVAVDAASIEQIHSVIDALDESNIDVDDVVFDRTGDYYTIRLETEDGIVPAGIGGVTVKS